MGIQVNPAQPAGPAGRHAVDSANRLVRGLGRVASGQRIDRAADDAAGLAISENLRASVRQLNEEVRGYQSGINLSQTADAGLSSQSDSVNRLRELSIQASNGTLTDEQRAALNEEAQQVVRQIDETAQRTSFNAIRPLTGEETEVPLDSSGEVSVELSESTSESLEISDVDLSTQEGAQAATHSATQAQRRIDSARASQGAQRNRLESAIRNREEAAVNQEEAASRIRDLDAAEAAIERSRDQARRDAGVTAVVRGNLQGETALRLLGG